MIGAGAAGLAAAWTLARAGLAVEVLERSHRPGGRMRTETFEGADIEVGAQFLAAHQSDTLRMAREVGAADRLVRAPGRDALWRNGRAHAIQYGSVPSMITSGALPARLKLKMASRYVPFLHRHAATLDPNDARPAADAGLGGRSIADWGLEHLGEDFVELLARPQTAAYYGSEPEDTSAALYHSLASAALDLALIWVRGGMATLARAWADAIAAAGGVIRLETHVSAVRGEGAGRVVVESAREGRRFRAAVVATPPARAAEMLEGTPVADRLAGFRSAASVLLAVALDRPFRPGWFGLGLPRAAPGGRRLAVVAAAAGRAGGLPEPHDRVALLFPAPGAFEDPARVDPRAAFELLWPLARTPLGGAGAPAATRARLYREDAGHSLFPPGFEDRLRALRACERPPGVALAGDYLVAPSVEGAVRSGIEAAREVLGSLG